MKGHGDCSTKINTTGDGGGGGGGGVGKRSHTNFMIWTAEGRAKRKDEQVISSADHDDDDGCSRTIGHWRTCDIVNHVPPVDKQEMEGNESTADFRA